MQAVLIFSRHRGALLGMLLDAVGLSYVVLLALSVSVTPAEGFLQFPALGNRCFPANMGESTGISRPAAEAWLRSYNLMARKLAGMSTETSASSNPFLGLRFDEHSARENTAVKLNRYAQPVRYEDFVLNWQRQETVTVMTEHGRFFAAKHTARASVGELAEEVFNVADKAIFKRHAHLHTEDEEECNLALVFNELMVAQLNSRRHEAYPQSDLVYFLQTITRLSQSVLRYVFRFWAETGHGWRVLLLGGQGWDRHYSLTKDVVLRERRHGGEARRNVTWVGDNFSSPLRRQLSPNKPLYAPRLADPALPPATKSLSVAVAAGKPRYVNPYSTTAKWPIFTTLNALAEELVAVLRITLRQINEKKLFAAFVDEGAPRPATSRSQQRDCETTLRVGHGVGMDGKFHGSGGAERLTCRDLRRRKVQEALGSRAREDEGEEDDPQEQNTSASREAFLDYWAGRKAEFVRHAKLNVNHEGEVKDGDDNGPKKNITRQINITPDIIPADSTLFDEPAAPTPSLQETYEWARNQFFNVSFIDKTSEKAREFFGIFNEKLSFDVPYWVQRLQNRVQMEKQTALEMQRKELSKASRSWDHYFRYDPYDPVSESYVFLRGVETDRGGDKRISRATFFRDTIQLEERLFYYDGGQSQQHQQKQQRLTESVAATPTATKTTTRTLASGTAKTVNFTERYAPHEFVLLKHEDERGHDESGTSEDVVVRKMNDDASRVKYDAGVFEFLRQPLSAQTLWEVDHLQAVFSDLVEAADGSLRKLPVFGNIFKAMMFRGLTGEEMDKYVACGPFFVFLQLVFRKMTLTSSSPESGTQEPNFDLLGALAELEKSMNQLHNPLKTLLHVYGPARRGSHTTTAPPTNRAGNTVLASDVAPVELEGRELQEKTRVAVVSCGLPGAATDQLRRFVEKMNPASATNDELPGAPSRGTPAADVVSFTLILVQPDLRVTLRENACFRYPLSAAVMKALEFAADNFDLVLILSPLLRLPKAVDALFEDVFAPTARIMAQEERSRLSLSLGPGPGTKNLKESGVREGGTQTNNRHDLSVVGFPTWWNSINSGADAAFSSARTASRPEGEAEQSIPSRPRGPPRPPAKQWRWPVRRIRRQYWKLRYDHLPTGSMSTSTKRLLPIDRDKNGAPVEMFCFGGHSTSGTRMYQAEYLQRLVARLQKKLHVPQDGSWLVALDLAAHEFEYERSEVVSSSTTCLTHTCFRSSSSSTPRRPLASSVLQEKSYLQIARLDRFLSEVFEVEQAEFVVGASEHHHAVSVARAGPVGSSKRSFSVVTSTELGGEDEETRLASTAKRSLAEIAAVAADSSSLPPELKAAKMSTSSQEENGEVEQVKTETAFQPFRTPLQDEILYLLLGHVTRQKALAQSNLLSAVGYDSGTGLPIVEDLAFQYQDHMLNTMTLNTPVPVARRPAAALQRHCLFLSPKAGNLLGKLFGLIQPVCIRQAQRNAFRSIVGWWESEPIEDEEQQNSNGGYCNFPLLWKSFTLNAVRSASEFGLFPWSPDLDLELATDAPYVRKNVVTKLQEHLLLAGGPMVDGTRTSGGDARQAQVIKFEWTSVGMEEGRDDYKADYKTSFLYAPLSWQDDNGVDLNVDVYWNSNVSVSLIRDQQESSSTASTAAKYAGASASAADGEDDAESDVADLFVMPVALDEIRPPGPSSSPHGHAPQMYFTERSGEFSLNAVLQSYGGEKVFSDPEYGETHYNCASSATSTSGAAKEQGQVDDDGSFRRRHNACPPRHCTPGYCEFEDDFVHLSAIPG